MKLKHLLACLLFLLACGVLAAPFTVSADGQEVTDTKTGLIWRRCTEGMAASGSTCTGTAGTFTHEAALERASAQATAAGVAWRLPNVKELFSIADKSRRNPAIDTVAFPAMPDDVSEPGSLFWSSSPYVGRADVAWAVWFYDGKVDRFYRDFTFYVRLVRAGQ